MYGIRSQLVHGNPIKESSTKGYQEAADWVGHEIKSREELARTYRTVLRQSLVKVASENVTISGEEFDCLLYTSPSPRDLSTSRMPSSA